MAADRFCSNDFFASEFNSWADERRRSGDFSWSAARGALFVFRCGGVAVRLVHGVDAVEHAENFLGLPRLQPVSYTHLDVYKRQRPG